MVSILNNVNIFFKWLWKENDVQVFSGYSIITWVVCAWESGINCIYYFGFNLEEHKAAAPAQEWKVDYTFSPLTRPVTQIQGHDYTACLIWEKMKVIIFGSQVQYYLCSIDSGGEGLFRVL